MDCCCWVTRFYKVMKCSFEVLHFGAFPVSFTVGSCWVQPLASNSFSACVLFLFISVVWSLFFFVLNYRMTVTVLTRNTVYNVRSYFHSSSLKALKHEKTNTQSQRTFLPSSSIEVLSPLKLPATALSNYSALSSAQQNVDRLKTRIVHE